ncbi:MAG: hypothetical protein M1839_006045 [Geoglossum umbratile]|nr:MAG: hypothetical protein M1839_006045 [Geoglossum umbratile]
MSNLLTRAAREVFKEDDSRRNKMKHFFLKIAKVLDTELTEAQKADCEKAQAFARDLTEMLQWHCTRHAIGQKPPAKTSRPLLQQPSWAEAARAGSTDQTAGTLSQPNHHIQHPAHTNTSQADNKRIFIRITKQHSARKLAPFAILQKLHALLPQEVQISEVQAVPTGFAILPKNPIAAQQVFQN